MYTMKGYLDNTPVLITASSYQGIWDEFDKLRIDMGFYTRANIEITNPKGEVIFSLTQLEYAGKR